MESWATRREERATEIMAQVPPQVAFWSAMTNMRPDRTPKTMELMAGALFFCMHTLMQFKHALACPRPVECR